MKISWSFKFFTILFAGLINTKTTLKSVINAILDNLPVSQDIINMALVMDRNKKTSGSAEDQTKLLASKADSWGINNGHVLFNIFTQKTVKESFVSILQDNELIGVGNITYVTYVKTIQYKSRYKSNIKANKSNDNNNCNNNHNLDEDNTILTKITSTAITTIINHYIPGD